MELKDIVSVSCVPGLHKSIGRNKTGLIVETIGIGKKFATTLRQYVSVLADIAIFTDKGETKLWQVLQQLKALEEAGSTDKHAEKSGGKAVAPKKVKTSTPKPTGGLKAKTTTPR